MEFVTLHFDNQYLKGAFNGYEVIGIINKEHVHTIKLGALVPTSMLDDIRDNLPTYIYDVRNSDSGIEFLSNGLAFDLEDANRYFEELCMFLSEKNVLDVVPKIEEYEEKLVDYWKLLIVAGIQIVGLILWAYFTFDTQLGKFIPNQSGSIYISDSSYASSALMPIVLLFATFYLTVKLKAFNQYDIQTKWKGVFISMFMSTIMVIFASIMLINLQAQALKMGLSLFMSPIKAYKLLEYAGWNNVVNLNLAATFSGWLILYVPLFFLLIKESRK